MATSFGQSRSPSPCTGYLGSETPVDLNSGSPKGDDHAPGTWQVAPVVTAAGAALEGSALQEEVRRER